MSAPKNSLLAFFASVQLALFLLGLLASTAIIGTIIPQNTDPMFYTERYGLARARFFELLDLGDMYNSWWFLGLLALFCLNLLMCSAKRLPPVLRLLRRDHLSASATQLAALPLHRTWASPLAADAESTRLRLLLQKQGWRARERHRDDGIILFAEKAPWSRLGVYVVHASILVILAGAVLGSPSFARRILQQPDFAYKGSLTLAEGSVSGRIMPLRGGEPLDPGFALRLDSFDIEVYDNGMPKSYRSRVTILDQGHEQQAEIAVNKPLRYQGLTFYQASYQSSPEYRVQIRKEPDLMRTTAIITAATEFFWPEGGISYGIVNRERRGEITEKVKLWLSDGQGEAALLWMNVGQETVIERPSGQYTVTIKPRYVSVLQAARDPGVALVYAGCLLMLFGLTVAFFFSHRQIFLLIAPETRGSRLLLAGMASKNRAAFAVHFAELANTLAIPTDSP